VEHLKVGETVALDSVSTGTRGTVVSVTADGHVVTVRWSIRFLQAGRVTTHRAADLARVTD
jgi:hypothetical protein